MKLPLILAAAVVLRFCPASLAAPQRLAGCPDPAAVATALAKLVKNDWGEVSLASVQAIWPTKLVQHECEKTEAGRAVPCLVFVSQSRIISNTYECSEAFEFDTKQNPDGSPSEQLKA